MATTHFHSSTIRCFVRDLGWLMLLHYEYHSACFFMLSNTLHRSSSLLNSTGLFPLFLKKEQALVFVICDKNDGTNWARETCRRPRSPAFSALSPTAWFTSARIVSRAATNEKCWKVINSNECRWLFLLILEGTKPQQRARAFPASIQGFPSLLG